MSPDPPQLFKSLGPLLRYWRDYRGITQDELASAIKVSEKTVGRWERSLCPPKFDNLRDIAEYTKIPMSVLVLLNADHPVYYSLRKRRFWYGFPEFEEFIRPANLQRLPIGTDSVESIVPIKSNIQASLILEYDHDIYPTQQIRSDLLLTAARLVPQLNLFLTDSWGYYAGHVVCLPLSSEAFQALRSQTKREGDLVRSSFVTPVPSSPSFLYFYSIYGSCSLFAYRLFERVFRFFSSSPFHKESLVAGYAVTEEGIDLCEKLRMHRVYFSKEDYTRLGTEVMPVFYECTVSLLIDGISSISSPL